MPYHVGSKGTNGCKGYPVVKEGGEVVGCHATRAEADNHLQALYANVPDAQKDGVAGANPSFTVDPRYPQVGTKQPQQGYRGNIRSSYAPRPKNTRRGRHSNSSDPSANGSVQSGGPGGSMGSKSMDTNSIKEGDYVKGSTTEGMVVGQVEHVMLEGGTYGTPGTEYAIQSTPENPAMAVRIFEEEDGMWYPTAYSIGMLYSDAEKIEDLMVGMEEDASEKMEKAETYTPTAGMKAAARRALKWKEDGKATGAGTPVGWGRASDIVAGRSMSISVVRRMYSFFSRHEVDKKGKDFYNTSNPSNGRIMWDAWGGDAGFSWSRGIVNRVKDKSLFADFGKDYTRVEKITEIFKADGVRVGQMVSWNSSGGRATGKVKRIINNGSYDVPGTSITVTGNEKDPAVIITLYRDGKATDITVAHKQSTLRSM